MSGFSSSKYSNNTRFIEVLMRNLPWQKIILFILILSILIVSSGCQSKLAKNLENSFDAFSHAPDKLVGVFTDLLGGLSDIGGALIQQIKNIVGGMRGR